MAMWIKKVAVTPLNTIAKVIDSLTGSSTENAPSINAVNTALAGKANSSHTHAISDVTNLQATIDAMTPSDKITISKTGHSTWQTMLENLRDSIFLKSDQEILLGVILCAPQNTGQTYVFRCTELRRGNTNYVCFATTDGGTTLIQFQIRMYKSDTYNNVYFEEIVASRVTDGMPDSEDMTNNTPKSDIVLYSV